MHFGPPKHVITAAIRTASKVALGSRIQGKGRPVLFVFEMGPSVKLVSAITRKKWG